VKHSGNFRLARPLLTGPLSSAIRKWYFWTRTAGISAKSLIRNRKRHSVSIGAKHRAQAFAPALTA
jgi:hypothetical protein